MKMKHFYAPILTILLCSCQNSQSLNSENIPVEPIDSTVSQSESINYLEKWGADEYGMRKYVMAFLKNGPNRDQDSTTAAEIQAAHLANIERMAEEGKLVVAGPFMDKTEIKGIYIFAVESMEEAEALTNTDPAVQAGRLEMELHPWYGSAALMELYDLHKLAESKSITK